jgi:hypothetical protein
MLPEPAEDLDVLLNLPGERRERLERNAQLVEDLRADEFARPAYDIFVNDLCDTTLKQLKGLLRTGDLPTLSRARFRGRGITLFVDPRDLEALRSNLENRDELAVNILLAALRNFRRNALVKGGWNPRHPGRRVAGRAACRATSSGCASGSPGRSTCAGTPNASDASRPTPRGLTRRTS